MGKKRKRKSGGNLVATAMKLARLGALIAPQAYAAKKGWDADGLNGAINEWMFATTGYSPVHPETLRFDVALRTWTPYILTSLITYGVPKINGFIRRLF